MFKNLQPLFPYLKRYRWTLFWGALTVFGNNGLWVLFPQILRMAVDDLNRGATQHKFFVYSMLLIGIALVNSRVRFWRYFVGSAGSSGFRHDRRVEPLASSDNSVRAGVQPYEGGFLLHYLDKLVYPNIPAGVPTAAGVVVCALNLALYARQGWLTIRR